MSKRSEGGSGISTVLVIGKDHPQWQAFWRLGQIREIASPGFAHRVKIAREEGLLEPLLLGDSEMVEQQSSRLIDALTTEIQEWNRRLQLPSDAE